MSPNYRGYLQTGPVATASDLVFGSLSADQSDIT
jgi:hypothetical protein